MIGLLVRIGLFVLFLFPVVIDQYSVNYLFAVFAGVMLLQAKRLQMPSKPLLVAMAVYVVIYLVSLSLDVLNGGDMALRRTLSFGIFTTIFVFSVVDLSEADIRAFKIALITVSLIFSLKSLAIFFLVGGNSYGFDLKNVVGSQRYGFVYLLALFTLFHMPHSDRLGLIAKVAAGYFIMAGLLLTFSRSSVIALGAVLPLYLAAPLFVKSGWSIQGMRLLVRRTGAILAYSVALFLVMPVTFQFYGKLLLSRYWSVIENALAPYLPLRAISTFPDAPDVFIAEGSEGTRLSIWKAVVSHTQDHPILGSGYLGSWTLDGVATGSAHNQYFDVILRTAYPGIVVYLVILLTVFIFLWRKDQGLFWGGIAVLVYGLFHETFKESQGAFILAFLIGMYATYHRSLVRQAKLIKLTT